jgi:tRNA-dihydrouridine synthase 3
MSSVTDCPLTLKMRTGVYQHKNIATKVVSAVKEWNVIAGCDTGATAPVGLMTIHGRSREQRYTKHADWEYISECALQARPIPVFGSGDVLGHEEYYERVGAGGCVAGAMIGRGALIKPWIFTEIKERRLWDISAGERLTKTRRFLLEWLSFLHRYIPVGVLERLPQRINERPPPFVGRTDLETLLSSGSCSDWLKISEMFLGKVSDNFVFYPKHKANAY